MLSQYSFDTPNGSIMRAKWEYDALKRNGFTNISIIDAFSKSSKIPTNCLFHAQQTTGQFLEKKTYISDLHGIAHEEMWHKSFSKSLPYWKRIGFRAKSFQVKKLEKKIWKNSLHLVCAGEMIYEKVKSIQSATIIRNSVNVDDYPIIQNNSFRIAVVGPFLPGTWNYDVLELLHFCVKNLPNINFDFIGDVSDDFKKFFQFPNIKFLGRVENYIDTLSNCSVLLSPYPEHSRLLAASTKMLEAGACQMAIVTSESGSIGFPKDFVLVGKTKHDFIEKLLYLKDENIRKTFGKKLRQKIVQNHNAAIEIKKLISLYDELL